MNLLKKLLVMCAFLLGAGANAQVPSICSGTFFNPLTDTDWNNIFPISVLGIEVTGGNNSNPPLMAAMPPICMCPSLLFGLPLPGIGITYWQPLYLSEIERRPGCLSSLGGVSILQNYANLHSEQSVNGEKHANEVVRMQVHWMEYPLFGMLNMLKDVSCNTNNGFNLAYMTEIDAMWQDDAWGAVYTPEAAIFANPAAILACAVDAVASIFDYPIDALFWCAGTWGNVYPLTGNSSHSGDPFTLNNQIQAKFIARSHRMGLMWQTIGPSAICSSHINPIWVKSQYRYNQVAPVRRTGRAVVTGSNGKLFQFPVVTNPPTQEHTVNLIWQGQQCCAMPIP